MSLRIRVHATQVGKRDQRGDRRGTARAASMRWIVSIITRCDAAPVVTALASGYGSSWTSASLP